MLLRVRRSAIGRSSVILNQDHFMEDREQYCDLVDGV